MRKKEGKKLPSLSYYRQPASLMRPLHD